MNHLALKVAVVWLSDQRTRALITSALLRGFRQDGVKGLTSIAFKIERGQPPFNRIQDPQEALSEIIGEIVRHKEFDHTPLSKDALFILDDYLGELNRSYGL